MIRYLILVASRLMIFLMLYFQLTNLQLATLFPLKYQLIVPLQQLVNLSLKRTFLVYSRNPLTLNKILLKLIRNHYQGNHPKPKEYFYNDVYLC